MRIPSDYGMINGSYGHLNKLPVVAGREGVGEVESIGPGVEAIQVGTRVRFSDSGAWRERPG